MQKIVRILAAAEFETKPLSDMDLGPHCRIDHVGIGSIAAAAQAARLQIGEDEDVLFLGSCGTFGDFQNPSLVTASSVRWRPTGDRAGLSYTIKGTELPLELSPIPGLPTVTAICGPGISLVKELDSDLKPSEAVENVELYAVAAILKRPISVVLGITNEIGPDAHSQWKANFAIAARETCREVYAQVQRRSHGY